MDSYFVVSDYMIRELGLRGDGLLAYALIDTCTQDGDGSWHGGYEKLADRIGCTRRNAIRTIQHLVKMELIEESEITKRGVTVKVFATSSDKKSPKGCKDVTINSDRKSPTSSDKKSPNNKYNNKEDNKVIRESVRETPRTLAEFVRMTDSEYAKLVTLMGEQRVAQYVEDLNNWKGAKGKQTKSDYFTIRSWYNRDKKEISSSTPAATSSSYDLKAAMAKRIKK